jgi:spermidine synthase
MGATLPLLASSLSSGAANAGGKISRLYALNTLGAALGTLAAGYLLLGHLGEKGAAALAAALNLAIALRVYFANPPDRQPAAPQTATAEGKRGYRRMLLVMGVSGFTALALEVLWARLLVLTIGSSVYAFSAMLCCYLLGIALGSLYAEERADSALDPLPLLARIQAGIAGLSLIGLAAFYFAGSATLDVKYLYSPLTRATDIFHLFGWSAMIIMPVTLLMGFFFPLAAQAGVRAAGRVGALGPLYGANTLGTILGSLVTGFILIPQIGTKFSFIMTALLAALTGTLLAAMAGETEKKRFTPWLAAGLLLAGASFALPDPVSSIINRRFDAYLHGFLAYHREDRAGAVDVVFSQGEQVKSLYINGVAVSGNGDAGKLMSHFPLLFQEKPESMFIIGLGAANTLRSGVLHGVKVTVAELLEAVREAAPLFAANWAQAEADKKFEVRLNDGRNELLRSRKLYDAIIVDVTPPIFSSGAVNLYSRDFFRITRSKLSKTGVLSLWIPLPCFESDYYMILRALKDVYPNVNVWRFPRQPGFLALASNSELEKDSRIMESRIKRGRVQQELPYVTARFMSDTHFMNTAAVDDRSALYPAVTDDRPYTEFPLARFMAFSPMWYQVNDSN